uniref:Uncharacterized protein n=1 Tax=Vespula pensylvanica TaxID=30213 RepID=A0A834U3X3_VESPE|nr:hypothetical protein H0235_012088 [Vespula pensylvanica]
MKKKKKKEEEEEEERKKKGVSRADKKKSLFEDTYNSHGCPLLEERCQWAMARNLSVFLRITPDEWPRLGSQPSPMAVPGGRPCGGGRFAAFPDAFSSPKMSHFLQFRPHCHIAYPR